jgi:hypothetical protein
MGGVQRGSPEHLDPWGPEKGNRGSLGTLPAPKNKCFPFPPLNVHAKGLGSVQNMDSGSRGHLKFCVSNNFPRPKLKVSELLFWRVLLAHPVHSWLQAIP